VSTAVLRPRDRPLLHLGLLGTTVLSTFAVFWFWFSGGAGLALLDRFRASLTFSVCLVLILGSHEMGHYLLARFHRVNTSLPYFIPVPFGLGTLGAVIRIRARIPDKNALVDIGAAGPLAGLAVALPILLYGLAHSPPTDLVPPMHWPAESSLWSLLGELGRFLLAKLHGVSTVTPPETPGGMIFGDNALTVGLKRLVLGALPPGHDIHEHPAYIAAWGGMLVTMLNLIPLGQLDGGHLTHALFGRRAELLGRAMALFMLGLCLFFSAGWIVWLVVTTRVIGFRHPEVIAPDIPLTRGRKWICALCAVALVLCVMPIPLRVFGG
jgi:membrane-associated protease RseP (regulator of RpoE activity)